MTTSLGRAARVSEGNSYNGVTPYTHLDHPFCGWPREITNRRRIKGINTSFYVTGLQIFCFEHRVWQVRIKELDFVDFDIYNNSTHQRDISCCTESSPDLHNFRDIFYPAKGRTTGNKVRRLSSASPHSTVTDQV